MADLLKVYPDERLDLTDFEHAVFTSVDEDQRLARKFFTDDGAIRVIDGFGYSISSAEVLEIALGAAFVVENREGVMRSGHLASEGVSTQTVDFTGLAVATYGVWVRFVFVEGEDANRAFWNENDEGEQVQNVKTRLVSGWNVMISATSPGGEWTKLYDVAWDGADLGTSTITDRRYFFFEGQAPDFVNDAGAWGGGDDRDPDRALYGVKTLDRFAAAMLKKLDELQGTDWYLAPDEPLNDKLSIFGGEINGDVEIEDASPTLTIDNTSTGFASLLFTGLNGSSFLYFRHDNQNLIGFMDIGALDTFEWRVNGTMFQRFTAADGMVLNTTLKPNDAADTLGTAATRFVAHFDTLTMYSAIAVSGAVALASSGNPFDTGYIKDLTARTVFPDNFGVGNTKVGDAIAGDYFEVGAFDTAYVGQINRMDGLAGQAGNGDIGGTGAGASFDTTATKTVQANQLVVREQEQDPDLLTNGIASITQRNLPLACGQILGDASLLAPHWNIESASNTATGKYRVVFDEAVHVNNAIQVSMLSSDGASPGNEAWVHEIHVIDENTVDVWWRKVTDAPSIALADLPNNYGFSISVFGSPNSLVAELT